MQDISFKLRSQGKKIGFVPTMGFLHDGHLSLVDIAKKESDIVVVSIFVNPTQFAPNEDFDSYPRDLERDKSLLLGRGVDYLFLPDSNEIYSSVHKTSVIVRDLTKVLCGKKRPTHFDGVTTVVTILFNIVLPHIAIFGQKDAQQSFIIKRTSQDLCLTPQIIIAPTTRHSDGLAMSSRNKYLLQEERVVANHLWKSLVKAKHMIEEGESQAQVIISAIEKNIEQSGLFEIDYIEIVSTTNLEKLQAIDGDVLIAIAAKLGKARLIDNIILKI